MTLDKWKYHNPVEIFFGPGKLSCLPSLIGGSNIALITTPGFTRRGTVDHITTLLGDSLVGVFDDVRPNPSFLSIRTAFDNLRPLDFDLIVVLGGGSAIDTAKAVTAMRASGNPDWIEGHLKHNFPFPRKFNPEPIITIPTTTAGSQATMWATIWDMDEKKKYSISHSSLYPQKTILDPELMLSLPEKETTNSALDAFSHSMEAIWNKNHNPLSDAFALKAISLIYRYLPLLQKNLTNLELRTSMLTASLFSSLAFSNTKTALAHSISYTLTANFGLPHGLACALTLPSLLEFNGIRRFDRVKSMAKALESEVDIHSMVKNLKRMFEVINVPLCLTNYGISSDDIEMIVNTAITPGRADNNIVDIERDDLVALIKSLF